MYVCMYVCMYIRMYITHTNTQGRTVFLEDSPEWSAFVSSRIPTKYNISIHLVHYKTLLGRDDETYLEASISVCERESVYI